MKRIAMALTLATAVALAACQNPNSPSGSYGTISGKVTSSTGQPVAGVVVVVDNVLNSAPSAADGSYTVQLVPVTDPLSPATVTVDPKSIPVGYSAPAQQTVQVTAGQTLQVSIVLPKG
jgi:hypothetical protein